MRHLIVGIGLSIAALTALPATAQNAEMVVAKGPGIVGVEQSLHLVGTISAIDAETRTVTLVGEQGREMQVEAGPEVRNFAQLAIGEQVELEVARALTLELHKDSTAEVGRLEMGGAARAKPGAAPAGMGGRRLVIMAEVTALDPETQTVTLQGPRCSLELQVPDPAQFGGISVGDRVEATYTEAVAVGVTAVESAE